MKEYITRDLFLGSWLNTEMPLKEIRQNENDRRMTFVFEDTEDRRELVQQYWLYEGNIPPKKLFDSFRSLRDRMFSEKQSRKI